MGYVACGTPFDSSENASSHEKAYLVEWSKHNKLVRQAQRYKETPKHILDVPIMFLESRSPLDYPEFLPRLTGGKITISLPLAKIYLLMTDEALESVTRRQSQRHAMHEVIDRDRCTLSPKKQKAREDPSAASSNEYTHQDKRNHEDLFVWEREYDARQELELSSRD